MLQRSSSLASCCICRATKCCSCQHSQCCIVCVAEQSAVGMRNHVQASFAFTEGFREEYHCEVESMPACAAVVCRLPASTPCACVQASPKWKSPAMGTHADPCQHRRLPGSTTCVCANALVSQREHWGWHFMRIHARVFMFGECSKAACLRQVTPVRTDLQCALHEA